MMCVLVFADDFIELIHLSRQVGMLVKLEAEELWPVLNEELEVKAQTRKQGGNGTIQQMAMESRSDFKKKMSKTAA